MPSFSTQKRKLVGTLLVALQFGLLLALTALAMPNFSRHTVSLSALMMGAASLALAAWTLAHNRLGNFNIHPRPKEDGILVTTGPYRLIRHPMYTSVLLGGAALALMAARVPAGWVLWLVLALVLWAKSSLEERWMRQHHTSYAAYVQRTKRFVPWIF